MKYAPNMLLSWEPPPPSPIPMAMQEVYKEASDPDLPVFSGPADLAFGVAPNFQKVFLNKKKNWRDKGNISI